MLAATLRHLVWAAPPCRAKAYRSTTSITTQEQLVDRLLLQSGSLTERAAAALRAVDRRHFVQTYAGVPANVADQDTALPISCGQTMPAFSVHARFLSLLEPHAQPGAAVLDLGAGWLVGVVVEGAGCGSWT